MRRTAATVGLAAVLLAACTSAGGSPRTTSAGRTTTPEVVDGITVPPPYVAPPVTVAAGPSSCPAGFSATLTGAAGAPVAMHDERADHLLTCSYLAARPIARHCSRAVVRINTEPQAFKAFDRWNVETGQNSAWAADPRLQPLPVPGVGIEAEWVPELSELGAANATTWASVVLSCPAGTPSVIALATTLARQALAST